MQLELRGRAKIQLFCPFVSLVMRTGFKTFHSSYRQTQNVAEPVTLSLITWMIYLTSNTNDGEEPQQVRMRVTGVASTKVGCYYSCHQHCPIAELYEDLVREFFSLGLGVQGAVASLGLRLKQPHSRRAAWHRGHRAAPCPQRTRKLEWQTWLAEEAHQARYGGTCNGKAGAASREPSPGSVPGWCPSWWYSSLRSFSSPHWLYHHSKAKGRCSWRSKHAQTGHVVWDPGCRPRAGCDRHAEHGGSQVSTPSAFTGCVRSWSFFCS